MKTSILQEYRPYSFADLEQIFSLSADKLENMLKKLSLMNIVKHVSKLDAKDSIYELLDEDVDLEGILSSKSGVYLFKFVGIINVKDIALIVYPKYLPNYLEDKDNNFKVFKQLIAVIHKYEKKAIQIGNQNELNLDTTEFNLLSLTIQLISDYARYGLYNNQKEIMEINGQGEILWEQTINNSPAYFSKGTPFYLDLYTVNRESDSQDYFKRLHAAIISDACEKMTYILSIIGIEPVILSSELLESFGSTEYILYRINQEIASQFVSYKHEILLTLKKYILEHNDATHSDSMHLIGSNSFHTVWEDVCKVYKGDCSKKSLNELNLRSNSHSGSTLLSNIIDKLKWTHSQSNKTHDSDRIIPDIVVIEGDSLAIYDAKYYRIKLDEAQVKNQPGVGDVTKQYLYEMAYQDFAKTNNLQITRNAFLMPTDKETEFTLGKVDINFFMQQSLRLKPIEVVLLPYKSAYDFYLKN